METMTKMNRLQADENKCKEVSQIDAGRSKKERVRE